MDWEKKISWEQNDSATEVCKVFSFKHVSKEESSNGCNSRDSNEAEGKIYSRLI